MVAMSWLVFLLYPVAGLGISVWGLRFDRRYSHHYIMIISLFLAIAAYYYNPTPEQDLYRYLMQIERYMNVSWTDAVSSQIYNLSDFLFFLVSRTGNPHLMPAVMVWAAYMIELHMICHYASQKGLTTGRMVAGMMFVVCLMSFPHIISVVRNSFAFTIFALAVYRDIVEKKRNVFTILLYAGSVLIHISALALIALRVLFVLCKKGRWIQITCMICLLLMPVFIEALLRGLLTLAAFNEEITIFHRFLNKAYNYVSVADHLKAYVEYAQNSLYMNLIRIYHLFTILFLSFLVSSILNSKRITRQLKHTLRFIQLCLCFITGLGFLTNPIYNRFYYFIIILAFIVFFESSVINKAERSISRCCVLLSGTAGLLNQMLLTVVQADPVELIVSVLTVNIFSFIRY